MSSARLDRLTLSAAIRGSIVGAPFVGLLILISWLVDEYLPWRESLGWYELFIYLCIPTVVISLVISAFFNEITTAVYNENTSEYRFRPVAYRIALQVGIAFIVSLFLFGYDVFSMSIESIMKTIAIMLSSICGSTCAIVGTKSDLSTHPRHEL